MIRKALIIAGVGLGVIVAVFVILESAEAGTCSPVTTKARASDPATATTRAQIKLTQRVARVGGKVTQSSTACKQGPMGAECKISAVVCP